MRRAAKDNMQEIKAALKLMNTLAQLTDDNEALERLAFHLYGDGNAAELKEQINALAVLFCPKK